MYYCKISAIWIRYDVTSSDRHQLFIKEHSIRNQEPEYPRGKTLFALNIPPYATVESVQNAFSECGQVKSVSFAKNSTGSEGGFKTGYIVFAKDAGLQKALSLHSEHTLVLSTKDAPVLTGIKSK